MVKLTELAGWFFTDFCWNAMIWKSMMSHRLAGNQSFTYLLSFAWTKDGNTRDRANFMKGVEGKELVNFCWLRNDILEAEAPMGRCQEWDQTGVRSGAHKVTMNFCIPTPHSTLCWGGKKWPQVGSNMGEPLESPHLSSSGIGDVSSLSAGNDLTGNYKQYSTGLTGVSRETKYVLPLTGFVFSICDA